MKNKKIISIIILLLISMILSSCAGPREIDDLGIVMATALDIENGKILLTNEVVIPKKSSDTSEQTVVYIQSTGDTVFDAYRNAALEFDRKLFLSHNTVLIFGEDFVKRGIGDYISFYLYDNEPRETAYMLVAKGGKAYDVLSVNAGLSNTPGGYLNGLIENFKYTSKTRSLSMIEYFKYYFINEAPVLGVVQKLEKMEIYNEKNQVGSKHFVLDVAGGAVFKQDKLLGYYTDEEMIGFNFLVDEIEGGLIVFETPDELTYDEKLIATQNKFTVVEILSSKTKKDVEIIDGKINLIINVKLKGILGEDTKGLRVTELKC